MYVFFKTENGQHYHDRLSNEFHHKIDLRLKAILMEAGDWSNRVLTKKLIVTCLNRTKEENDKVGGRPTSAHFEGRAADLRTSHLGQPEIDKLIGHLNKVWGLEFLHTKYHDDGTGFHLHININFPFKRNTLT